MQDNELLGLAAKAAGHEYGVIHSAPHIRCDAGWTPWDPREDDGDALRLLAAIPSLWQLSLMFGAPTIQLDVMWGHKGVQAVEHGATPGPDRAKSIRCAIVRAAAEIGKAKAA